MNTKIKLNIFGILFMILAVVIDQMTKFAASSYLRINGPVKLIPGIFHLQYLENRGAAFGIFQHKQLVFVVVAAVILLAGAILYQNFPVTSRFLPVRLCILCIAAGAVGNMIDRVRLGYVVDFFYFILINFPIFNVADIYVTVSIAFLILLILFYYTDEEFQYFSLRPGVK